MIKYVIGIIGVISLMVIWVIIQSLWRNTFMKQESDGDVLAERSSCGNCGCSTSCTKKQN